ncbi:ATP-binding protein [Rhodoferax sp.]|uniref:ATP-binding protein n=1 Tax=Rhodoferax sp. TaxID=50421 RepID=UPI00273193EB|nr:ATP-binding protein [Rhodoferax sp.]MDP1528940.1 ATP-binding protein [Rhodoferax sp.]MDP1943626.1 ATP-binding protein [Rhodoferax sp.]MDP2440937.1 ATP-binding protein [Rhodoferax sp.]MDP3189923.1 ATP-binding protein [Rhodoferax sp.]MDP3336774.1 ATP-binding protein [Rhodoferax sp.]
MPSLQRICLIGAECTGKSTLAQALAAHFGGLWVPEYLRSFCELNGRTPSADEQAAIMRAQFEQEEQVAALALQAACGYVFCDGAPLLTAIYSDYYFADRSLFDCAHTLHARYALTLLLHPDLPWLPDGFQRDGEVVRTDVHALVQHALQAMHVPHIDVEGRDDARLQAAILAVETLTG